MRKTSKGLAKRNSYFELKNRHLGGWEWASGRRLFVGYRTTYYRDRNYAEARLSGVEPTIADERAVMDKNARALMISYIICGNVIKVCTLYTYDTLGFKSHISESSPMINYIETLTLHWMTSLCSLLDTSDLMIVVSQVMLHHIKTHRIWYAIMLDWNNIIFIIIGPRKSHSRKVVLRRQQDTKPTFTM